MAKKIIKTKSQQNFEAVISTGSLIVLAGILIWAIISWAFDKPSKLEIAVAKEIQQQKLAKQQKEEYERKLERERWARTKINSEPLNITEKESTYWLKNARRTQVEKATELRCTIDNQSIKFIVANNGKTIALWYEPNNILGYSKTSGGWVRYSNSTRSLLLASRGDGYDVTLVDKEGHRMIRKREGICVAYNLLKKN